MNAREQALQRDLDARVRLAGDPLYQIKQRRTSRNVPHQPQLLHNLTPPELRALGYRSRGLSNQMTADALGVSIETIKTQLKSARTKLRAKDTTGACCNALRRGLID